MIMYTVLYDGVFLRLHGKGFANILARVFGLFRKITRFFGFENLVGERFYGISGLFFRFLIKILRFGTECRLYEATG